VRVWRSQLRGRRSDIAVDRPALWQIRYTNRNGIRTPGIRGRRCSSASSFCGARSAPYERLCESPGRKVGSYVRNEARGIGPIFVHRARGHYWPDVRGSSAREELVSPRLMDLHIIRKTVCSWHSCQTSKSSAVQTPLPFTHSARLVRDAWCLGR
jgi:hypothetical protein